MTEAEHDREHIEDYESEDRPDDSEQELGLIGWTFSVLLIFPVRLYQTFISPLLGPTCRFSPTCSQYFIEAVRKYGPIRGAWRGVCRIARCHPFHPGGHDPP